MGDVDRGIDALICANADSVSCQFTADEERGGYSPTGGANTTFNNCKSCARKPVSCT
jgi:hypothetical protein